MPEPSLRDQLAEALRTAPSALMDTPEERARHAANPRNHHTGHHYYWGCAMCRGEVDTLADAVHGVVQAELDAKDTEIRELRRQLTEAQSDLEAWDELRAQAHEQMRAGFAESIRGKWDAEASEPDADMAADACIDYLENEYAGQIAKVTAERDRLAAEVRGLEETAAERQQNARHWQERAEAADVLLEQASDEIERLNTDLAGWELYNDGPPARGVDSTPDISDHVEP